MDRLETGHEKERYAADYLTCLGYKVIEMNYRKRTGEIDIIARDGDATVFVEVKYRKSDGHGQPFEAVDYRKRQRLSRTAMYYIKEKGLYGRSLRFDIVGITGDRIVHYKNAFSPTERFGV